MLLLIKAREDFKQYKAGDIVDKYDMTVVMEIKMCQHRMFIRVFDRTKPIIPWVNYSYPRSKVYLRFEGANTGTYNCMLWNNRNRKGLS